MFKSYVLPKASLAMAHSMEGGARRRKPRSHKGGYEVAGLLEGGDGGYMVAGGDGGYMLGGGDGGILYEKVYTDTKGEYVISKTKAGLPKKVYTNTASYKRLVSKPLKESLANKRIVVPNEKRVLMELEHLYGLPAKARKARHVEHRLAREARTHVASTNPWIAHVKMVARDRNLSYKKALQVARASYNPVSAPKAERKFKLRIRH